MSQHSSITDNTNIIVLSQFQLSSQPKDFEEITSPTEHIFNNYNVCFIDLAAATVADSNTYSESGL